MNNLNLKISGKSDTGKKRIANEDYYGAFFGNYGNLLIVCDGMGGHKGGAIASRMAVEVIENYFRQLKEDYDPVKEIDAAIKEANKALKEETLRNSELAQMGTTLVLLLIVKQNAYWAHVGDSRIYLIRDGSIKRLTKDHSYVQQLIDAGVLSREQAENHPKKNVILRSLGAGSNNEPEISGPFPLKENDVFLLCSDGLTIYVSDEELLHTVMSNDCQTACDKLVDLANERGGKDNITVQIAKILNSNSKKDENDFSFKTKAMFVLFFLILTVGLSLVAFFGINEITKIFDSQSLTKEQTDSSFAKKYDSKEQTKIKKPSDDINPDSALFDIQRRAISDSVIESLIIQESDLKNNDKDSLKNSNRNIDAKRRKDELKFKLKQDNIDSSKNESLTKQSDKKNKNKDRAKQKENISIQK